MRYIVTFLFLLGFIFAILDHFIVNSTFTKILKIVGPLSLFGFFGMLYFMRNKDKIIDHEVDNNDDYKSRFGDVPAATMEKPPKPIDKTGNVFEHNNETLIDDLINIGIDPDSNSVNRFLDTDFRPDATVITSSNIEFEVMKESIEVDGILGSITSSIDGEYVGFAGVSIPYDNFKEDSDNKSLQFILDDLYVQNIEIPIITVQIVDYQNNSYALDLKLSKKINKIDIPFDQFVLSIRGKLKESEPYSGSKFEYVRIFLKRSTNEKNTTRPIKFNFKIKL